jgi:hypothetical protein
VRELQFVLIPQKTWRKMMHLPNPKNLIFSIESQNTRLILYKEEMSVFLQTELNFLFFILGVRKMNKILSTFLFVIFLFCNCSLNHNLRPMEEDKTYIVYTTGHFFFLFGSFPKYNIDGRFTCKPGKIQSIKFHHPPKMLVYFTLGLVSLELLEYRCEKE